MTKHLPNFITILNLLCGTLAVFFAIHGRIETAAWLIFTGALFDFGDGFVARALHAYSETGKELDSLADLISFGVAPAAILSSILYRIKSAGGTIEFFEMGWMHQAIVLFPFVMVAFAALRLAKFNLDTRQTESFLGLTTTATGIFTASFALLLKKGYPFVDQVVSPVFILIMVTLFCGLLVSEIPMFSLKFKKFGWKGNQQRYLLLLTGLVFIALFDMAGISMVILLYILFSIVTGWVCRKKSST